MTYAKKKKNNGNKKEDDVQDTTFIIQLTMPFQPNARAEISHFAHWVCICLCVCVSYQIVDDQVFFLLRTRPKIARSHFHYVTIKDKVYGVYDVQNMIYVT